MDKVTGQCPQTTAFLKRKESRSGIEPRSFRLPAYRLTDSFYVALRPRRRDDLLGTGTEWEGGQGDWLDRGNRPKKTGETVDRRQNNGSVKAVSPRHCPATCALRNCSFNCCAGQSH